MVVLHLILNFVEGNLDLAEGTPHLVEGAQILVQTAPNLLLGDSHLLCLVLRLVHLAWSLLFPC